MTMRALRENYAMRKQEIQEEVTRIDQQRHAINKQLAALTAEMVEKKAQINELHNQIALINLEYEAKRAEARDEYEKSQLAKKFGV